MMSSHCPLCAIDSTVFVFSPGLFSVSERTELGVRLRRAITRAETNFLDLSDYNCDSRSFCVPCTCRTLAHSSPALPPRRCLFITPDARERRYEGDTTGNAWRYLAPSRRVDSLFHSRTTIVPLPVRQTIAINSRKSRDE